MGWTDERVELLKKLWADGLSASQIAAELGGITRNAVIGKVHRLGLSGRAKSPSSSAPRPRKARSSGHMMRVPERIDGDARRKIEVAVTLGCEQPSALAPLESEIDARISWQYMRAHGRLLPSNIFVCA